MKATGKDNSATNSHTNSAAISLPSKGYRNHQQQPSLNDVKAERTKERRGGRAEVEEQQQDQQPQRMMSEWVNNQMRS